MCHPRGGRELYCISFCFWSKIVNHIAVCFHRIGGAVRAVQSKDLEQGRSEKGKRKAKNEVEK